MRYWIIGTVACLLIVASCADKTTGPKEPPIPSHPGSIMIENGSYQSCLIPMVVTVVDTDLVGATVPIRVKSTTDPTGFILPLTKVPGASGTYSDSVFFSIVNSDSAGRRIRVQGRDTVTVVYTEASPARVDSAFTLWTGAAGSIMIKNGSYQSYLIPMVVTVVDTDLVGATVPIRVKSTTDPTGFILPLTKVPGASGTYSDSVFFSIVNSDSAGRRIRVQDGDTVTASYAEASPARVDSAFITLWTGAAGSIMIENGSYQSCQIPMVVTVVDTDLVGATVPIRVKSTTDPTGFILQFKSVAGAPGTYSDSVFFSIVNTDSAERRIRVLDGDIVTVLYAEASPARVDSSYTLWTGMSGTIGPGASIYSGLKTKLSIEVFDQDVTDSTLTVQVKSDKDTAGIHVTLHVRAGSPGDFIGQIGFTFAASQDDSVISVMGTVWDNISMIYHDLTPVQEVRGSICTWQWWLASMYFDSSSYHGTLSKASIFMDDGDILDSTVVVTITSKNDPVGISDTLKLTNGSFTGEVGFTTTASTPGFISVQDNDTVTVLYHDDSPDTLITLGVPWNSN